MKPDPSREFSYGRFLVGAVVVGFWLRWLASDPWVAAAITAGVFLLVVVVVSSLPGATIDLRSVLTTPVRPRSDEDSGAGHAGANVAQRSGTDIGRVVLAIVGGGAVLVLIVGFAVWNEFHYDPPANDEAKRREQLLVALRGEDLGIEGLRLVSSGSDAGRPQGEGPFETGNDVTAGLGYEYEGDAVQTCQTVLDQLLRNGWVLSEHSKGCADVRHEEARPDSGFVEHDVIVVHLRYDCLLFEAEGIIHLNHPALHGGPPDLRFSLSTAYPFAGSPAPGLAIAPACRAA